MGDDDHRHAGLGEGLDDAVAYAPHRLVPLPSLNHYFIGADELPYKLQPGNVRPATQTSSTWEQDRRRLLRQQIG
jgi:hypothetical protein